MPDSPSPALLETLEPRLLLDAAPHLAAIVINGGQAQRNELTALAVQFSASLDASPTARALHLRSLADGAEIDLAAAGFAYDPAARLATWDLAALHLPDGRYAASLDAWRITAGGTRLDGNADGVAGDDPVLALHRLAGDLDGDAEVGLADLALLASRWNQPGTADQGDLTGDGRIDLADLARLSTQWNVRLPAADAAAPAAVSDLAADEVRSGQVRLAWRAPGDDGAVGTAWRYELRRSTQPITAANWNAATPVLDVPAPRPAGQGQSFTVTGLEPATKYWFALRAFDGAGNASALSNVATATTAVEVTRVVMPAVPDEPPAPVASAAWDTTSGWGNSYTPEDGPMTFARETNPAYVRQGSGAVRFTFDASAGPQGMKYYQLPGVAGSDGFAYWVYGDGSGATVQVRLSQSDWSAWDSPLTRLDFTGWRRIVVLQGDCPFHDWGGNGRNWDDARIFAFRVAGSSASVVLDDLRFYSGTAGLKVDAVPAAEPITLIVDQRQALDPVPAMLAGVDFALINWGADQPDLNFGPETRRLFEQSDAKLVRFWTYCPPLNVSPAKGTYDWTRFDGQMSAIFDAGATTIMTCCFTPSWLSVDGTKEGLPKNWADYERLVADTVRHTLDRGWDVAYWEVWNEPNLAGGGFLKGDIDDLNEMYAHFASAVRSVDPAAKVGGAGFASPDMPWIRGFAQYAHDHGLPLDFLSWHTYDLLPDGIGASIEAVRDVLAQYPNLADAELIIDEWNAYGGPQNQYDTEYAAAFQAATLDRMVAHGLAASTFFAFNESNWQFPGQQFGGSWGMLTAYDVPKASYHSFDLFAELTGERLRVTGADGEVGALAVRNDAGGVDVLVYRFQPDANAPDRAVRLDLPRWLGAATVTLELVDDAHSNAYYDLDQRALETVGRWGPLAAEDLPSLDLLLPRLAVARVRILPAMQAAEPLFDVPADDTVFAGDSYLLPAVAGATWTLPEGWTLESDGRTVGVPASELRPHAAYLVARRPDGAAQTLRLRVAAPGVEATLSLAGVGTWLPGETRTATIEIRNYQALGVAGSASVWSDLGLPVLPAEQAFVLAAGGTWSGAFELTLPAGTSADGVVLYPRVVIESLQQDGRPMAVLHPSPLAAPQADAYTTLLSTLGSAAAITAPAFGPAGTLDLKDGAFVAGVHGGGVLLKAGSVRFPNAAFPAQVGSVELWITPQWNGTSAPDWATFFLRTSGSGWAKSMWDLRVSRADGQSRLVWALHDDAGTQRALSADIAGWQAGQAHHVMLTWNAYTGHTALYLDGVLAQENLVEGGLVLSGEGGQITLNSPSGRSPANAVFGPVRISNAERVVADALPAPAVRVRARGVRATL